MTAWSDLPISPEHAAFLAAHAITPEVAQRQGVHTVATAADLPPEFEWAGDRAVPAIAFPWRTPGGRELVQLRPDVPVVIEGESRPAKYLWPKDSGSPIGIVREDEDGPVIFIEGTKQSLAGASYVESGAVYAIAGCRTWSKDGVPEADLDVVEGRAVIVIFDADVETNPDVHDAAKKFLRALEQEGATDVRFALLAAGGKAGLDDVLGKREEGKRALYVQRLLAGAVSKLPKRPTAKSAEPVALGTAKRPPVAVNDDRLIVTDAITEAIRKRWDGRDVFSFGGVIATRADATLTPVTPAVFVDLVQHAVTTVAVSPKGDMTFAEPTATVMQAALSRARSYTQLDRVATVPFVRPDGTICQAAGYDEATRTYLVEALPVTVPDDPSDDEVRSAVKLLCDEWLGDLFASLPGAADRANALALILTPLIRGLVPVVPLAVVNGLQMGVGKNLLADMVAIFSTGATVLPLPWAGDDAERGKMITSAFRTGRELFVFDEAHVLEGAALARALTAATYTDRLLGVSTMAEWPNNITWMSLGNNVQINGDMSRRVFVIRLAPEGSNPQDRSVDDFRHPDIKGWTQEHRAELVAAGLTLVRAWFAAGRPPSAAGRRFGSFEKWGGMVGGVLELAGVEGFLGNLQEWRSESDYDTRYWVDHLGWVAERFPAGAHFTVAEVVKAMKRAGDEVEHPPRLEDHEVSGYGRELGKAYGKVKGRSYDGYRLLAVSTSRQHGNRWELERPESDSSGSHGGVTDSPPGKTGGQGGCPPVLRDGTFSSLDDHARNTRIQGPAGGGPHLIPPDPMPGVRGYTGGHDDSSTYPDPGPRDSVRPTPARGRGGDRGPDDTRTDVPVEGSLPDVRGDRSAGRSSAGFEGRIRQGDGASRGDAQAVPGKRPGVDVVTANGTAWTPAPDPERSPAESVLGHAVEIVTPKYGQCPDCEAVLVPVPPHGVWRACRSCTPDTFAR